MKPKECAKYVYRRNDLPADHGYCEVKRNTSLISDFEIVWFLFSNGGFRLDFYHHGNLAKAWRDKHNNIIVRVHHADTQTNLF